MLNSTKIPIEGDFMHTFKKIYQELLLRFYFISIKSGIRFLLNRQRESDILGLMNDMKDMCIEHNYINADFTRGSRHLNLKIGQELLEAFEIHREESSSEETYLLNVAYDWSGADRKIQMKYQRRTLYLLGIYTLIWLVFLLSLSIFSEAVLYIMMWSLLIVPILIFFFAGRTRGWFKWTFMCIGLSLSGGFFYFMSWVPLDKVG